MPYRNRSPRLTGTAAEIVMQCQSPQHQPHEFKKADGDVVRAQQLSQIFEGRTRITSDEAPAIFQGLQHTNYSLEFEAKRAGECIAWGVRHGVITRVPDQWVATWEITEAERPPLFVEVGSWRNPRTVRTRRWASPEEEKQARKDLKREAGRRERERVKRVAERKADVQRHLSKLFARAIDVEARGVLERYTVPGITKLVEIQGTILQGFDDLTANEAWEIENALRTEYAAEMALPLPNPDQPPPADEDDDTDLDILADL